MGDPNATPPTGEEGKDVVAKADFDTKLAELDKAKQELEDMRMEVFSPDYMAFLDAKDKGKEEPKGKEKTPDLTDDEFKGLTPKQLIEKARALAREDLKAEFEKAKEEVVSTVSKDAKAKEVAAFARSHEDFETFRPIMYGLSLDPKNKNLTLDELYDKSKEYIQRHAGPSKEERERQAGMSTEKPGGDNQSFEKYKKMSPEATAKESLEEVKSKLGPIPTS